jgi:hypothetical protein
MQPSIITLGSFQGVAAGQTATLDLPAGAGAGLVYYGLRIEYAESGTLADQSTMEAGIDEVRILINGVVQRRFSAAELNALNAENGIDFDAGQLKIFFAEPWRRSAQGEDALAWGVADVDTFQVEIDIASGATSPSLKVRAHVVRNSRPLGAIMKWRKFTVAPSATGIYNLTTLPRQDSYARLHFFENAAGDIDDIEVLVDGRQEFKATDALFESLYGDNGLTPQAALTTVAFDHRQRVSEMLAMRKPVGNNQFRQVTDFRVDINFAAANAATLLTQTLGPRD